MFNSLSYMAQLQKENRKLNEEIVRLQDKNDSLITLADQLQREKQDLNIRLVRLTQEKIRDSQQNLNSGGTPIKEDLERAKHKIMQLEDKLKDKDGLIDVYKRDYVNLSKQFQKQDIILNLALGYISEDMLNAFKQALNAIEHQEHLLRETLKHDTP